MKKTVILIMIIVLVLAMAVAGFFLFQHYYLVLDTGIYLRSTQALDLSGQALTDLQKLPQLKELKSLDLRDTGLTVAEYEALQKELPQCSIQWLLPFQGSYLPLDTQQIKIAALSQEDIALLPYLPDLKIIDATEFRDYDAILALQENNPQYEILYRLNISGTAVDQNATEIATTDINEILSALSYLPDLTSVNAAGCQDYATLLSLTEQYPNCEFYYEVPFCDVVLSTETEAIEVATCTAEELAAVLPHLKDLKKVTIANTMKDPSGMLPLKETYPDIDFSYRFYFLDHVVSNRETQIDISNTSLTSLDFIDTLMPHFICLEKVDMCGCGISDEDMGALNERYPDTLFVWIVAIGRIKLRTDSTYLMPFHYGYDVTDEQLDNMKYLTELICLDFGHMPITRTDYLAYMPKMQYLILGVTDISDLTPLANLKELKYLELFMSDIRDLSPLLECEKLEDLNIGYTYPEDISPLLQMTQLKNLWFCNYWDMEGRKLLREALLNTTMVFEGKSSTGGGWRKLPNYYAQRDILGMYYMIED